MLYFFHIKIERANVVYVISHAARIDICFLHSFKIRMNELLDNTP